MANIRLATASDVSGMSDLLSILFEQEVEFSANEDAQTEGLAAIVDAPHVGRLMVCEVDQEIVGMVNVLYTVSTAIGGRVAILEDMIVRPDFRGRGLGRKLAERAIEQCRADGCRRITLLTDSNNIHAHGLYERVGFHRSRMVAFRLPLVGQLS